MSEEPKIIIPDSDLRLSGSVRYSDDYKTKVFQIWFNNGKPIIEDLLEMIPIPETNYGRKPSISTLQNWVNGFKEHAEMLDVQIREEIDNNMVASKIEMLKRHAEVGREAQKIALDYLREAELTPSAAVRLLADGVAIERGASGIPEALAKLVGMTDDQLLEALKKELEDSPIESIESNTKEE